MMSNLSVKAVGLMTGTSMDGVSACILETDSHSTRQFIKGVQTPFPRSLRDGLKEIEGREGKLLESDHQIIEMFTEENIKAVEELLKVTPDIAVIGFHGQTVYHNPAKGTTMQLGLPQMIKGRFGIPVAYDFRSDDVSKGGQGAPLVPMYHRFIASTLRSITKGAVVFVNCGGIANISIVECSAVRGWDTGAGNTLLDRFVSTKTLGAEAYDRGGAYGLKGCVDKDMLNLLYQEALPHGFCDRKPPKSLDIREIKFPDELLQLSTTDGCATLAKFTAETIMNEVTRSCSPGVLVLSGGGWHNKCIVKYLRDAAPNGLSIKTADEVGLSTDYMEAELIAYLAVRTLHGDSVSLPEVTGASSPGYARLLPATVT